jgi:hypothetical protein
MMNDRAAIVVLDRLEKDLEADLSNSAYHMNVAQSALGRALVMAKLGRPDDEAITVAQEELARATREQQQIECMRAAIPIIRQETKERLQEENAEITETTLARCRKAYTDRLAEVDKNGGHNLEAYVMELFDLALKARMVPQLRVWLKEKRARLPHGYRVP